ncbi:hypothetical protein [Cylindrospermopsis raciborskii]|nr:hypothetical protein [Cylindrospermopsis raciborskii]
MTENVYRQSFTNREPNMKRPSRRAIARQGCNAIASFFLLPFNLLSLL